MIPFPLLPEENTVVSLLVPTKRKGDIATHYWRFLLTAEIPDLPDDGPGPLLFHSMAEDMQRFLELEVSSDHPAAASRECARYALERCRASFTAVLEPDSLKARQPKPAPAALLAAARIVEVNLEQALVENEALDRDAAADMLIQTLNDVIGPSELRFHRLIFVREEQQIAFEEVAARLLRQRMH